MDVISFKESIPYFRKGFNAAEQRENFFVDKKRQLSYCFRQKQDNFYATMEPKRKAGARMEQTERRETKEEWRLPKNVRQIGEPGAGPGVKILIEDYVYTYLHQMAESHLTCIKTAVLVGRMERDAAVYIQGAVETDMGQEPGKWFSHEHWSQIFREIRTWFEGLEVVGWYMANPGFPPVLTEELSRVHMRNFSGHAQVFFQTDILDKEEIFYMCREGRPAPVGGYYIYYERNDRMQAYMSSQKGGAGIEPESAARDRAAARFRNVMQEKREQNVQRKTLALLYTSCMFLVLVILVIGVTLVNNYDRMASMEHALHQISESLGREETAGSPEDASMEEAVEEENRLAALGEETPQAGEEPTGEEIQPDDAGGETTEEEAPKPPEEQEPEEEPKPEEPVQEAVSSAVREPERYRVQKGDTLLEISRLRYGNDEMVQKICEINGLEDGDKIYVGEIILLP